MPAKDNLDPTLTILRLGDRYVAAWAEVDFRIAQRQNALQIYVTLAAALIAVIFTGKPVHGADPFWFSLLLPVVSLAFASLNYKHEQTIGILRRYLENCEKFSDKAEAKELSSPSSRIKIEDMPQYHLLHYSEAQRIRRHHDWAAAGLVIIFNVMGFFLARTGIDKIFDPTSALTWLYIVLASVSVVWIWIAAGRPDRP